MGRELLKGVKTKDLYFKILKTGGQAPHQTNFKWPEVGEWSRPIYGSLRLCSNGYHLARPRELFNWLAQYTPTVSYYDPTHPTSRWNKKESRRLSIYVVEAGGDRIVGNGYESKICCRKARLLFRVPWNDNIRRQLEAEIKKIDATNWIQFTGTWNGKRSINRTKSIYRAFKYFSPRQQRRLVRKLFGIWNLELGKSRRGEAKPKDNPIW